MNRARLYVVLLIAAASAVLAAMLVSGMMGQQPTPPVVVEAVKSTSRVLVATKDIPTGEKITALSVEWRDWPRDNIADYMITEEAKPNAILEVEGARARATIFSGEPIAERAILKPKDGNLMSALVRKGLRGYAMRVSDRTGGGGFILPNDRVDIISTVRARVGQGSESDRREIIFSRTIITNARVLAVNQSLAPDGTSPNIPDLQTAVIELEPEQAELVARADSQGELSLALRSLADGSSDPADDDRPKFAALSEVPNSVQIYDGSLIPYIMSCEPNCEVALRGVNAPFPLVVRDAGISTPISKP